MFNSDYENLRINFNAFAEENGLKDDINAYIVAKLQDSKFDSTPYWQHGTIDTFSLIAGAVGIPSNFDALHHVVDYVHDKEHYDSVVLLEKQQRQVSDKLMQTLNATIGSMGGIPNTADSAFVLQKVLLSINTHFLHPETYEDFKNLREKVQLQADKLSYQQNVENNELLKLLQQNQDQTIGRMIELKKMQAGLNTFVVNAHADLQGLILQLQNQGIEVSDQLKTVLLQLKDQGIAINANVINSLLQNKSIQNDVQTVLAYLKDMELEKIRKQQYEIKMANYQGLASACGFVCELGSMIGSNDLVRVGQIGNAGIQIYQASEQLLSNVFSGVAILNPYMAIGMAALKIFSLFQNQANPQKILMKQLANIAKQIKVLHQDVLKNFGIINEKLNYIFQKILEGFAHIEISLHVYIENKLLQIQNEIITLTKITETAFENLLTQDLFEQTQHVEDINQEIINPCLTQSEFNTRMGKLSRFITEESCSKFFNGLVYEHLLKDSVGSTQQIINICSQHSTSIWQGVLGLLIKFSQEHLNVPELKQIYAQTMFHPGFWRIAVDTYCKMLVIYASQYSYDPKKLNIEKFKKQGEQLLKVIEIFSTNKNFYQNILSSILQCNTQLGLTMKQFSKSVSQSQQQPRLIFEIPTKIQKSDKNKAIHNDLFTIKFTLDFLKKARMELPAVFFTAQTMGLGYLEFQWHLPDSVRSREHHKGEKAISKGQKAGLEVTFVSGVKKLVLIFPGISDKHHCKKLEDLYFHILKYSRVVCTKGIVKQVETMINENGLDARKKLALNISNTLQQDPVYHRLLKLNYFLIAYLTFGGFPEELILNVKRELLLENVAEQFADFAQNFQIHAFPEIKFADKNLIDKMQQLIYMTIDRSQLKVSEISAYVHQGILCLNALEVHLQLLAGDKPVLNYKLGQIKSGFFANSEIAVPKVIKNANANTLQKQNVDKPLNFSKGKFDPNEVRKAKDESLNAVGNLEAARRVIQEGTNNNWLEAGLQKSLQDAAKPSLGSQCRK